MDCYGEYMSFCNKGSLLNLWRRIYLQDWAPEKHQLLLNKSKKQRYEVNYHPGVFTKPIVVDRIDVYEEGYEVGKRNTDATQRNNVSKTVLWSHDIKAQLSVINGRKYYTFIKWSFPYRHPQWYIIICPLWCFVVTRRNARHKAYDVSEIHYFWAIYHFAWETCLFLFFSCNILSQCYHL